MIDEVIVVNRNWVETIIGDSGGMPLCPKRKWNLISIHGDSKELLTPNNAAILKQYGCKDYISLCFWDITPEMLDDNFIMQFPHAVLFNEYHAQYIILFLNKLKNETENETLVVHCDAGISRSGAVGEFASDFFELKYNDFLKNNPYIHPNVHIRALLRRCLMSEEKNDY